MMMQSAGVLMNGYIDITQSSVEAVAVQMEINGVERSEDFADQYSFAEGWAARHNREVWGTPECGMYSNTRTPSPCPKAGDNQ
jgi:hypothetical protein